MTRLNVIFAATAFVAALGGAAAHAADDGDLVTVTPRQDKAAADAAAAEAAKEESSGKSLIGPIHGSVGAMIGTGGARAMYGTVDIPIGENGIVSLSYAEGRNLPYYQSYYGYSDYGRYNGWLSPLDTAWGSRAIRRD